MKRFIISVVAIFCLHLAHAQEFYSKYGEVSQEDLRMKSYALDTTASAVILFDHGEIEANRIRTLFRRHVRIKLFRKEAFDEWGSFFITTDRHSLSQLKGAIYRLVNNVVVKDEVSNNSIFKKRRSKLYDETSFVFPHLTEGCIVEFSYTVLEENFVLPEWTFQTSIPTRMSEYIVNADISAFRPQLIGKLSLTKQESKSTDELYHRWVMNDIPAFRKEPFMPHQNIYLSSMRFAPSYGWMLITSYLYGHQMFGKIIFEQGDLKKYVEEITKDVTHPHQQVKAIIDHIKQHVSWDKSQDIFGLPPLKVLENKKGSSGDINLLLGSMLAKAGFEVQMVLLSTRENGFIIQESPRISQFDYVVCRVRINDTYYLLDATEPYLSYLDIPERCLNHKGLAITFLRRDGGVHNWIEIVPRLKDKTNANINLVLSTDGNLSGKIEYSKYGYTAFKAREKIAAIGEENYKKEFLGSLMDRVSESSVQNIADLEKPVVESYTVTLDDEVRVANDLIYFDPFVALEVNDNPFTDEKREFPVYLDLSIENAMVCNITIPEGYQVEQLPSSKILALPEEAGKCMFNISNTGNKILVSSRFIINKTIFLPEEYQALREFYSRVIAKQNEQVVIKKK